jgi:hypothetical protein
MGAVRLTLDDLDQTPLQNAQNPCQFMATLQHLTRFAIERPHALFPAQRGRSIRACGLSALRLKAEKLAASLPKSIA